jgi:hypothetical protein
MVGDFSYLPISLDLEREEIEIPCMRDYCALVCQLCFLLGTCQNSIERHLDSGKTEEAALTNVVAHWIRYTNK